MRSDVILFTWFPIYTLACIWFSRVRTGSVQIRKLKDAFACIMEKKADVISYFQALMIAAASRVETGNISIVATSS